MGGRAINKAINKQHASCLPPVSQPWKKEIVQETKDTDVLGRGYALISGISRVDVCSTHEFCLFICCMCLFRPLCFFFLIRRSGDIGTLHQKMIVVLVT